MYNITNDNWITLIFYVLPQCLTHDKTLAVHTWFAPVNICSEAGALATFGCCKAYKQLDLWLIPADPLHMTFDHSNSVPWLWSGFPPNKFGWLTPVDLCIILDPINALHLGQGFFPSNLVAIRYLWTIWSLVEPRWPLHDPWPNECSSLQSRVLLTKFGSHKVF